MQHASRNGAVVLLLFALAALIGCGEKVEDINRVQPHYVKKSSLEGQWYFRQTVVDRPPEFAYYFTGIEGALEKIRWEVRENALIAYRVHPAVVGLEDDTHIEGADYKGSPVAVYPIIKHFDIIRDFNTSTGEQSNVLVENSSLKPWYEREYMRVAWESNTLDGPVQLGSGLAQIVLLQTASSTGIYYDVETDPYNPDRLQLGDDFIFLTTNYVVTDNGYSCILGFGYPSAGGWDNCGSVEVKVRSAFAKIDEDDAAQFEPKAYLDRQQLRGDDGDVIRYVTVTVGPPGDQTMVDMECTEEVLAKLSPEITDRDCRELSWSDFNRFGYFRTERRAYDRRVGGGHDHNRGFYANHHQMWKRTKDENGDLIPVSQRELRPIVYYINTGFPEDLKATAIKIQDNWNDVFMKAAMAATGRSAEEIGEQLRRDADPAAVYLPGDEAAGPAKLFQVRENNCSVKGIDNFLFLNPEMRTYFDEATGGELLKAGNKERACSALNFFSVQEGIDRPFEWQQMGDVRRSFVWWVNEAQPNGPLGYGPSSADMETGQLISGNAHVYGAGVDSYARGAADIVRALNGDLALADILGGQHYLDWIKRGTSVADSPAMPTPAMQQAISDRMGTNSMQGYRGFSDGEGRTDKAAMIRHMRDRLTRTTDSDPLGVALNAAPPNKEAFLERVRNNPTLMATLVDDQTVAALGPLFNWRPGDTVPEELEDMALRAAIDPEAQRKIEEDRFKFYAERNVYLGEFMDDSIAGQALSMKGMDPEEVFQQLRREIFEAVMLHEIGHTVGLRHNFKASFDALNYQDEFWDIRTTRDESEWQNLRLAEYRYTSIMDYGSRFNSDTKGLGKYDYAAIKYLYGGHLEVFEDSVPLPGRLDLELELEDYRKIPELLGNSTANITARKNRPVDELVKERRTMVANNAALYLQNSERSAQDYQIERTVPYFFCTDSFNGDLKCKTWDEGSTITESVQAAIQNYWNYYIFNNYRRGRDEISFQRGFQSRQMRVLDFLTFPWQFYSFYDAYDVGLREDLLQASMLGINFVNQVIGTPEPGLYCQGTPTLYLPADLFQRESQLNCQESGTGLDLGLGQARDLYLQFSNDHIFKLEYMGSFFDKRMMLLAMFSNATRFFKILDYSDDRQFSINYYRTFREEMLKVMRDVVMGAILNFSVLNNQYQFITDSIYGHTVDVQTNAQGIDVATGMTPQLLVSPFRFENDERGVPDSRPQVYTPIPYNLATQVLLYAAWTNSGRYDQQTDFLEYITVMEAGSGDFREYSDSADAFNCPEGVGASRADDAPNPCVASFTHPMTGQTYVAVQTFDGKSIAHELVKLAQQYVEADWLPRKLAYEADPDDDNAAFYHEQADRQLQEFTEILDYLRELRSTFDVGHAQ